MNENLENSTLFIRLLCIASSSALIAIPQILWSLFGYQGFSLIALESFFILLGFAFLLSGLMGQVPRFIAITGEKIWARMELNAVKGNLPIKLAPLGILAYSLYLFVPSFLSHLEHYKNIPVELEILLVVLTLAFLGLMVVLHQLESQKSRSLTRWYYIPIAALAITWAIAFWYGSPEYPTDEMLIDFYSAHLALSGTNPYIASNTIGVFSFIHSSLPGFPMSIGTPLLTGGLVTSLSYPALSLFAYIPSQYLGLSPTGTILPLYVLPALIIFFIYSREKYRLLSLFPVFILLLNPSYLIQTGLGYPDIVWVIFMLISIYFYRKPVVSGLAMGLALAVKQIPWVAFPFFLIFIYRESGKKAAAMWAFFAAIAFLMPNLSYLLNNPASFFQAIISPGFVPLMGIGFGPSQLGFLGMLPLSRGFFTTLVACIAISCVILYVVYYEKLKFAFLAFPLIIFLFNYRFLLDYEIFWPVIALILPAVIKGQENVSKEHFPSRFNFPGRNKVITIALAVLLLGVPLSYHVSHADTVGISIGDIGISAFGNSNITAISLDLQLAQSNLSYNQVLYRIVPWSTVPNLNGYLWHYSNLTPGNNVARVTLVPENSLQQIPFTGNYRLIAYYGGISTTMSFTVYNGRIS